MTLTMSIAIALITACTTPPYSDPEPLRLHEMAYGGCAGLFDMPLPELSAAPADSMYNYEGVDTLVVEWDDSLRIFVGLNYICCAPFSADHAVRGDTLVLAARDTCPDPYESCYCWCVCYYTFTWMFADGGEDLHYLQVELHDPRADGVEVLYRVEIEAP